MYLDKSPWPSEADGNGSYLQLISTDLDNSLATSWQTSDNINLSSNEFNINTNISIFPNPFTSILNISAKENIQNIIIYDISGKMIKSYAIDANQIQLDLNSLSKGFYFVKITNKSGYKTEKLIKQ